MNTSTAINGTIDFAVASLTQEMANRGNGISKKNKSRLDGVKAGLVDKITSAIEGVKNQAHIAIIGVKGHEGNVLYGGGNESTFENSAYEAIFDLGRNYAMHDGKWRRQFLSHAVHRGLDVAVSAVEPDYEHTGYVRLTEDNLRKIRDGEMKRLGGEVDLSGFENYEGIKVVATMPDGNGKRHRWFSSPVKTGLYFPNPAEGVVTDPNLVKEIALGPKIKNKEVGGLFMLPVLPAQIHTY